MSQQLLQPRYQLTEKTRIYNREGPPANFEPHSDNEFNELSTALQVMQAHLSDSDIQLQRVTYRDALTGLNNRLELHQELSKLIRWHVNRRAGWHCCISTSKSMNLLTVCEGTETIEQQYAVTRLGCDFAQGFLFSEPLLINQLKEQLA